MTFSNALKKINSGAFENCASLTQLTLPVSLKEIGNDAFEGCNNITDIYINSSIPIKISGGSFAKATMKEAIVHVKKGATTNYNLDKQWKKFLNIIEWK